LRITGKRALVALALAALGVGDDFCEQARSMEVDVRVEVTAAEGVDQPREALRDVAVAEVLAHDGIRATSVQLRLARSESARPNCSATANRL
jgi:hypothetical protein